MVLLALLLGISSLLCRTILEENLNFRADFQQKIAFAHWPRIILFWTLGAGASHQLLVLVLLLLPLCPGSSKHKECSHDSGQYRAAPVPVRCSNEHQISPDTEQLSNAIMPRQHAVDLFLFHPVY